ncbi:MAG: hypothetical protein IKD87_10655 [Oscillospiraceae bacterium]|nr:hypothetical protein [Oscillospiraceae bacterium]
MRYYIRYREDLKWEEINRTQAAMWIVDDNPDNRWRLAMLTIPNFIRCNGVEIKVVGDHGEQPDARTLNAVPDQFRDKARQYDGMQNLEAALEMGKKVFRQAFSVVLNLYVFAFKVSWEILKRIFRAIEEMREEERYGKSINA